MAGLAVADSLTRRMDQVGEAELLAAATAGQILVCGNGRARRRVSADLLRRCCRELRDQVDPRGLRLSGAEVTGHLDLAGMDVPFPLRFDGCSFTSVVTVEGAQLGELALTGCDKVPGLLANGVRNPARPGPVPQLCHRRAGNQRQHIQAVGDLAL